MPKKMHLNQSTIFFWKPNLSEWAVGEFNEVDLEKKIFFEKAHEGSCCLVIELAANKQKLEVASFEY